MPLLTILVGVVSARLIGQAMQEVPAVMVLGGEDSPRILAALHDAEGHLRSSRPSPTTPRKSSTRRIRAAVEIPRDFDAGSRARRYRHSAHLYVSRANSSPALAPTSCRTVLPRFPRTHHPRAPEARALPENLMRTVPHRAERTSLRPKKWEARCWADWCPISSSCFP